jgi:transposase IS4-like protein/DDE family transposase
MRLAHELTLTSVAAKPEQFEKFTEHLDREWIEEALAATGTATFRRRRLPAEQVVWLVIGMALMRNRPIAEVVEHLDLALPARDGKRVAKSAVPKARARVGAAPLEWLFERTGNVWGHESADRHRWRGLALYGVDGTTLRVPDSDENRAYFSGQPAGQGRGDSGYPQLRLVTLMALRSHLLAAASFGPYSEDERAYAWNLWPSVPDDSLTIVDRGYLAATILMPLERDGNNRHWLTRATSRTVWSVVRKLGKGDLLVELKVSSHAQRKDESLPKSWLVRAIEYQHPGHERKVLLTSLTDAERYPAEELVALYHERWEIELSFDEVKTELLEREETIRSKGRDGVEQEMWGILLAYNLVRLEMERIADEAKVEPTRISFVTALRMIRSEWEWSWTSRSPGAIPKHLQRLRDDIARFVLPPRRPERSYPRAVKIKMSAYNRNRRNGRLK